MRDSRAITSMTSIPGPSILFPEHVSEWAVLRTAARWEKRLADLLTQRAVPIFLPLMTRLSMYSGKRRAVEVPIFSGYVFCSVPDFLGNQRISPGIRAKVAQVLRPPDPAKLRTELKTIADLLADRQIIQQHLVGGVGDSVRIVGGALDGFQGIVVRTKPNQWKLVLEISFLGARREFEVDEPHGGAGLKKARQAIANPLSAGP